MFRISSVYLLLYVPYMQNLKKKIYMPTKLLLLQNWGKIVHLPRPTTGTSFGNLIYTTIVCNEYTPLS